MLRNRKRSLVWAFVTPKALYKAPALPNDDNIQNGDTGSIVTVLQKMLFDLDFKIKVDGKFRARNRRNYKAIQQKHNLPVTGIVPLNCLEVDEV